MLKGYNFLKSLSDKAPKDENGKALTGDTSTGGVSGAGSVVINYVDHTVLAQVGRDATASAPAIINTPANIQVTAGMTQVEQNVASATVTKPDGATGSAVAVAVSLAIMNTDAEATVVSHSRLNAGGATAVAASVTYPYITNPKATFTNSPTYIENNGLSGLATFFDGTLGLGSQLLNTWVVTAASSKGNNTSAVSGSSGLNLYFNTALATVQDGASLNANMSYWTGAQSVSVTAATSMQTVEMAGIGSWTLTPHAVLAIGKSVKKSGAGGALEAVKGGKVVDLFNRGASTGSADRS